VLEVVPIQALANKLAEVNGIEAGMVRYISKTIKEEASRLDSSKYAESNIL